MAWNDDLMDKIRKAVNTTAFRAVLATGTVYTADAMLNTTEAHAQTNQITNIPQFVKDFKDMQNKAYVNAEAFRTGSYLQTFSNKYPNARAVIDASGGTAKEFVEGLTTETQIRQFAADANAYKAPSVSGRTNGGAGGGNQTPVSAAETKAQDYETLVSLEYRIKMYETARDATFQSRVKANYHKERSKEDRESAKREFGQGLKTIIFGKAADAIGGKTGDEVRRQGQQSNDRHNTRERNRDWNNTSAEMQEINNAIGEGRADAARWRQEQARLEIQRENLIESSGMNGAEQAKAKTEATALAAETERMMTGAAKSKEQGKAAMSKEANGEKTALKEFLRDVRSGEISTKKGLADLERDHPGAYEALYAAFEKDEGKKRKAKRDFSDANFREFVIDLSKSQSKWQDVIDSVKVDGTGSLMEKKNLLDPNAGPETGVAYEENRGTYYASPVEIQSAYDKSQTLKALAALGVTDKADEIPLADRSNKALEGLLGEAVEKKMKEDNGKTGVGSLLANTDGPMQDMVNKALSGGVDRSLISAGVEAAGGTHASKLTTGRNNRINQIG